MEAALLFLQTLGSCREEEEECYPGKRMLLEACCRKLRWQINSVRTTVHSLLTLDSKREQNLIPTEI